MNNDLSYLMKNYVKYWDTKKNLSQKYSESTYYINQLEEGIQQINHTTQRQEFKKKRNQHQKHSDFTSITN